MKFQHKNSGFAAVCFAWICISCCRAQQDPLFSLQVFLTSGNNTTSRSEKLEQVNRVVQGLAFRSLKSLHRCRTGTIYNVSLPSELTPAITAQAVRLRSGSLRRRGFIFNEFTIPKGAQSSSPPPTRLLLVYRKFDQGFMRDLYPFIDNDDYHHSKTKIKNKKMNQNLVLAAPVIGIKAYDASNLSATDGSPELKLVMKGEPASVNISYLFHSGSHHHKNSSGNSSRGGAIKCVILFGSNNKNVSISSSTTIEKAENGGRTRTNICSFNELGDFSLVLPVGKAPVLAPAMAPSTRVSQDQQGGSQKISFPSSGLGKGMTIAVVATVATAGMVLIVLVKVAMVKKRRQGMWRMEQHSEVLVMERRMPTASASRTKPDFLEQECFEAPRSKQ